MRLWIVRGSYGTYSMTVHWVTAKTEAKALQLVKDYEAKTWTTWEPYTGDGTPSFPLHPRYKAKEGVEGMDSYIE